MGLRDVPDFSNGLLPPGDYPLTVQELKQSKLVLGPGDPIGCPDWSAGWRATLVDHFTILSRQLWAVGVDGIYLDGSFVEDKDHPNDIDGYFVCDMKRLISGDLQRELNLLDPHKIWTWDPASRRPYRGYPKSQLPMWHQYRVELYPHFGQSSGIHDERGFELEFPAAFRRSRRDGRPKGIVSVLRD